MRAVLGAGAILGLAACATIPADGEPPVREPVKTCHSERAQRFVGQKATAETGAAILAASGAAKLRWLAPNSVVTMEYAYGE